MIFAITIRRVVAVAGILSLWLGPMTINASSSATQEQTRRRRRRHVRHDATAVEFGRSILTHDKNDDEQQQQQQQQQQVKENLFFEQRLLEDMAVVLQDGGDAFSMSMSIPTRLSPAPTLSPETPTTMSPSLSSSSSSSSSPGEEGEKIPSDTPTAAPSQSQTSLDPTTTTSELPLLTDPPSAAPTQNTTTLSPTASPSTNAPSSSSSSPIQPPPQQPPQEPHDWQRLGSQIMPLQEGGVGTDVALSASGHRMAVGVPWDAPGYVADYEYDDNTLDWTIMGWELVDGDNDDGFNFLDGEQFGHTVDLSSDGMTVTAGSGYSDGAAGVLKAGRARVFQYNSELELWTSKGQSLSGDAPCRSLGWSVALSGDGNRWVVSTPDTAGSGLFECANSDVGQGKNAGMVQVFDYDEMQEMWIPVGGDLIGPTSESYFGLSVAISRDGMRIAVQSIVHTSSSMDPQQQIATYSVFELRSSTTSTDPNGQEQQQEQLFWKQMGTDIQMEIVEFYTRGVALNADGSRVVVASKRFATGAAFVRVYEWEEEGGGGGIWSQLGQEIEDEDGCCDFYTFENSVAISDDGNRIVFGNSGHEPPDTPPERRGLFRGVVRVYDFMAEDDVWTRVGDPIPGTTVPYELWFGYSTAISASGNIVAAGAPIGLGNYVQAYELVPDA